jgi:hypothetical protein
MGGATSRLKKGSKFAPARSIIAGQRCGYFAGADVNIALAFRLSP